ncbi:MAG TPA: ABC transporter substrate-binding protein [Thermomicrobiales bacterium]|nr:ABC transporter substrate-binding protein [Thermomicrobiales bacterium]
MAHKDHFEETFRSFITGDLNRRRFMLRAAGLAGAAAAVSVPMSGRMSSALAQDATPEVDTADIKMGGTFRMGMQSDPGGLDPQLQSLTACWHVVEHIYNRLTAVNPDLSVSPELAESWEISDDGLTYTFKLHPATFHNGRAVVAGDVKYSYERLVNPETASPSAADLASMDTIEAPDDATVVITLKQPDASFLAMLSSQSTIIIPKEVVEENGDLTQVAIGSGPFKFVEYVPNTHIKLEKYADYWEEGVPYVDNLELLIAAEDTSRTAALVQGSVDFIEYAPSQDIPILEGDDSIKLAGNSIQQIRMIGFNLTREPFTDLKVRQAIAKVIDRGPVIDAALSGYGTPTEQIFSADFWPSLGERDIPAPDIEGAKALLAEAGFADGFKTTITGWAEYGFLKNTAVVVQEQLKQIGIEAELNLLDTGSMGQVVYIDKDFDLAVTGDSGFVDPNGLVYNNFASASDANFVQYNNPDVDKLISDGIATTDQAARTEIYQQLAEILLQDLPWVCLYIGQQYEAMKDYVMGYEHIPTGSNITARRVWLDQ